MELDDITIGKLALQFIEIIRSDDRPGKDQTVCTDAQIAEMLLTSTPGEDQQIFPIQGVQVGRDDFHRVIERALSMLLEGNGMVYYGAEAPRWLQVSLVHEGKLPLAHPAEQRMVRLSSIDQVAPIVSFGAAKDSRSWCWNLQVKTRTGDVYWASDRLYKGRLVIVAQEELMGAIEAAVIAESRPVEVSEPA